MFIWELVEEGLEYLIAFAITNTVTYFAIKVISTFAIMGGTIAVKTIIKRFLLPFILSFTKKDGHDKTNLIKKIFKRRNKHANS